MPDEFDIIENFFRPLACPEGLDLMDDAACLPARAGFDQVISTDVLVAGTHFFEHDDPYLLAFKALSVNVSDIAAKGGRTAYYMLGLSMPSDISKEWLLSFSKGLGNAQKHYSISLIGGDTTKTAGPITLSITVIGYVPSGQMIKRSNAKVGDSVYVTGCLGDAALGLKLILENNYDFSSLLERYYKPVAQHKVGPALIDYASSSADVSDGLIADLGHICKASNVGALLHENVLPISADATACLKRYGKYTNLVWSGGDDYEIVFTATREKHDKIEKLSTNLNTKITCIGEITSSKSIQLVDKFNKVIDTSYQGFQHFN